MSADQPASSGDADQPASGQPDRAPERSPQPEQPAAPADSGQPGSNRSRAEYAATLRNAGWDTPPQPPSTSTDHTQPTPAAADNRQPPRPADTTASSSSGSPEGADTTTSHDSDPARHEQAGQPDSQDQAPADDTPPSSEPQPLASHTEPATTQPDHDAPTRPPDSVESRKPSADTNDTLPPPETGNTDQPTNAAAADPSAHQPSRADYAASLRSDGTWTPTPATTSDRTGQPGPDHELSGDISPGNQETADDAETPTTETVVEPADASNTTPDTAEQVAQPAFDAPEAPSDVEPADTGERAISAEADQAESARDWESNSDLERAERDLNENLQQQAGAEAAPEIKYVDGRPIHVTHNPAHGVWVDGLPGEMPGTPIGDPYGTVKIGEYLGEADSDAAKEIWATRTFRAAAERLDDISDSISKTSDSFSGIDEFLTARPGPTIAMVGVRDHALGAAAPGSEQGQTVAHGIEATLVGAILAARIWQAIKQGHRTREG